MKAWTRKPGLLFPNHRIFQDPEHSPSPSYFPAFAYMILSSSNAFSSPPHPSIHFKCHSCHTVSLIPSKQRQSTFEIPESLVLANAPNESYWILPETHSCYGIREVWGVSPHLLQHQCSQLCAMSAPGHEGSVLGTVEEPEDALCIP